MEGKGKKGVAWSSGLPLLVTPRVIGSNQAQGIFVGFIFCLYKIIVYVLEKKIYPYGMATFNFF